MKQIKNIKDIRQQQRKMTEIARPQIITPEMLTTEPLNGSTSFSSRCPYDRSVRLECSSELNEREVSMIWEYNQLYNNWSSLNTTYYEHIKKTILILHFLQDDLNNDNILYRISHEKNPTIVECDGSRWELFDLVAGMRDLSQDEREKEQEEYRHDDTDPELLAEKNVEIDRLLGSVLYLSNLGFCAAREEWS